MSKDELNTALLAAAQELKRKYDWQFRCARDEMIPVVHKHIRAWVAAERKRLRAEIAAGLKRTLSR